MIRKLLLLLLGLLLIIIAGLYFLLFTHAGFNTALTLAEKFVPGKLTIQKANGKLADDIQLDNIDYSYNGFTLSAKNIQLTWAPFQFILGSGHATLQWQEISATLNKKPCLDSQQGQLKFTGNLNNPLIAGKFQIDHIQFPGTNIQTVTFLATANKGKNNHIQIDAHHLNVNDTLIDSISASLTGHLSEHQLQIKLNSTDNQLYLDAHAGYVRSAASWKGLLNSFSLNSKQLGHWQLKTPTKFKLGKELLLAPFCVTSPKLGTLCGEGKLDKHQKWQLKLNTENFNLDMFKTSLPPKLGANGNFKIACDLSGNLNNTKITGKINLSSPNIVIKKYGLDLKSLDVNLRFNNTKTAQLAGQVYSGLNPLKIKGTITLPPDTKTPSNGTITGQDIIVMNNKEYKVNISPNIHLTWQNNRLNVTGNINLTKAEITPKDFTSTVTMPDNVVIIDRGQQVEEQAFPLYLKLQVNLSNPILVAYAGLFANLSGGLTIEKVPDGVTTASGNIRVTHGFFKAYNQRLNIRTGELYFTGGAISDPGLNILAAKTIRSNLMDSNMSNKSDITVGVQVTGMMSNPKISLYSSPKMENSKILPYLLFGQNGTAETDEDKKLLAKAHAETGKEKPGVLESLQSQLAKADFGVESGNMYDPQSQQTEQNTSVVVGKQLSNRLSINYSMGVIIPVSVLRIRYILSKYFTAQTDSSPYGSGADIFYTVQSKD